jgi:hypothetical protein
LISIKLVATISNRSAIGAKVRAQATINGRTFSQVREINCGSAYVGQNGLLAHFGLGDATNVTTLSIEWPSGIVQVLTNVASGQMLPVVEHQEYKGPLPVLAGTAAATNGLQVSIIEPAPDAVYALEASTNLVSWTKLMARTSIGGTYTYTDTRMTNYVQRFYRVLVP